MRRWQSCNLRLLVLPRWPKRCLGQLDAMKMKVAAIGGIADTIRMSGVPESMKRGERGGR